MSTAISYRRYPEIIKTEVARTGNVYLFPDLKIPRTTAQYWVKKQKTDFVASDEEIESIYKKKSEYLTEQLAKEKAMRELLETVRKVFPYDFREKQLKNKLGRSQIISAIRECLKYHKLSHALDAIGLSKSSYQRWASEISFCKTTGSPCQRRQAFQLTIEEISTMKKFVTSKKFAHISVASLHLLAQRQGELFCSIHTWYKYVRFFDWKRPWTKKEVEIYKTGIRATRPNEIWHLDVTVVNIGPGLKFYIQAVIDNFSRFVIAWRATDKINAENTIETIALARTKVASLLNTDAAANVMMDPGTENRNDNVLRFISSKNLTRTLAQVDIHYSNSMIERLFYSLKNNYLYRQDLKGIEDLSRKADFYFGQHNNVIPLALHRGGTPAEVFRASWNDEEQAKLEENKKLALVMRRKKNLSPPCEACPS